jgi:twinkle protein
MGVMIGVHPKAQQKGGDGKIGPPGGYDIAGSAAWFNRADLGITIHRNTEGLMEVHCWKARYPAFGKRNHKAVLKLDRRTGRLSSVTAQDVESPDEMQEQDRGY